MLCTLREVDFDVERYHTFAGAFASSGRDDAGPRNINLVLEGIVSRHSRQDYTF